MRGAGWCVAVFAGLASCGVELPAPRLDAVEPSWGWNQELTEITIRGRDFHPRVSVDAAAGEAALEGVFQAVLVDLDGDEIELTGVVRRDDTALDAVVRRGLPAGLYALEVRAPSGGAARLEDAYTVTDIQASRLELSSNSPVNLVGDAGSFDVQLLDPNGQPVLQSFEVVISASDAAGLPVGEFHPSDTFDQVTQRIGELTGALSTEGFAFLALTVNTPSDVTLRVAPSDPLSPVTGSTINMAWLPGNVLGLRIALPPDDDAFEAQAGVPFVVDLQVEDQFGNPVDGAFTVTVKNDCGGFAETVLVEGRTPLEVTLTAASDAACADGDDHLYSDFGPFGESAPFVVQPGPLDRFEISAGQTVVRAGDRLGFTALAADSARNPVDWPGEVVFTDTEGGLEDIVCEEPIGGRVFCTGMPTVAADEVRLVASFATTATDAEGRSDPFTVLSSLDVGDMDLTVFGDVVAGEAHDFVVAATDPWGNPIDPDDPALTGGRYAFSSPEGPLACMFAGNDGNGALLFRCVAYLALRGTVFTVTAGEVEASSAPVDVINGPLVAVDATILVDAPVAGEVVPVSVRGLDAWGNPYVVHDDPTLVISDSNATFEVLAAVDRTGEAAVDVVFTVAGPTAIEVRQDGALLGVSPTVDVSAGPSTALGVQVLTPWAWVGDVVDVRVESIDAWGNRTDYDGVSEGELTAISGASEPVLFSMVNGVGTANLTWPSAVIDEQVDAVVDALIGSSRLFQVVRDCPEEDLELAVAFSGRDEAIACTRGDGTANIAVSFSGSRPADLALYGAASGDAVSTAGVPLLELELPGAGVYPLDLIIADRTGCAVEGTSTAWVGAADGQPVGPVPLVPDGLSLPVRGEPAEDISIAVGPVVDCSLDPVSGGRIRLRTDRGTLGGVAPSGEGLELVLDSQGEGTATLSTAEVASGGDATVWAWASSGTALGDTTLDVLGDEQLPIVWDQSPRGAAEGLVGSVFVEFSEPMLVPLLQPSNFVLDGPRVLEPVEVRVSDGARVVEVVLPEPVDAAEGAWTLEVSERVQDTFGNLLDGAWLGGVAAPYLGSFGDVGGALDDVTCEVSAPLSARFRPDGDPGLDEEADEVTIAITSPSVPAWWIVTIYDASGAIVDRRWEAPAGPSDTWAWDGRDVTGGVVADGTFEVVIQAGDGAGNRTLGCVITPVVVDNHGGA